MAPLLVTAGLSPGRVASVGVVHGISRGLNVSSVILGGMGALRCFSV